MEIQKVIAGALVYVIQEKKVLSKALVVPFLVLVAIDSTGLLELSYPNRILIAVISAVVQVIFAVTTHRIILLGKNAVPAWGIMSWGRRETFFILYLIGLGIMMIPLGFLAMIPVVGSYLSIIMICWFVGRFCLVFPGIAVDKGVTFKLSWELTKNYQVLMFLVVVVLPILLVLPFYLLLFVPYTFMISSIFSTLAIVFEVAVLSMAYQLITQEVYGERE